MGFIYRNMVLHYGGSFMGEGLDLRYEGGIEEEIRHDVDEVCYYELKSLCDRSGWKNAERIFYLRPGFRLGEGLVDLYLDDAARSLRDLLLADHLVHIYVEHRVDTAVIVGDCIDFNTVLSIEEVTGEAEEQMQEDSGEKKDNEQEEMGTNEEEGDDFEENLHTIPVFEDESGSKAENEPVEIHVEPVEVEMGGAAFEKGVGGGFEDGAAAEKSEEGIRVEFDDGVEASFEVEVEAEFQVEVEAEFQVEVGSEFQEDVGAGFQNDANELQDDANDSDCVISDYFFSDDDAGEFVSDSDEEVDDTTRRRTRFSIYDSRPADPACH